MFHDSAPFDTRELVSRFRENFVNFHLLWKHGGAPPGLELKTPAEEPIPLANLPAPLRQLLDAEQKAAGGEAIHLYKYMRIEDGQLVRVIEDERGLPDPEDFLSLSHTSTLLSGKVTRVVTEVFVGQLHPRR